MTALIRGELIKLRTTRTAAGFGAAVLLLVVAAVLLSTLVGDVDTISEKRDVLAFGGIAFIVMLVFGVVGATSEYRHRTLAPTLLIAPNRARLAIARIVAYSGAGLLIGLVLLAVTLALGLPLLAGADGPALSGDDYLRMGGGGLLVSVLSAALGAAIGTLVRNQVAAIVGVLVWLFVAEPLVGISSRHVRHYSLSEVATVVAGATTDRTPTFAAALVGLAIWTAAFAAGAILVDRRRDVT